jgi:shikimate dehydrogenase
LTRAGAHVTVVNRTLDTARTMIAEMSLMNLTLNAQVMTLDEAAEQPIDLIVNCTSAGMYPNIDDSPWVAGIPFPRHVTVYDMIYRPAKTALMQMAEAHGGQAIGGAGMLVRQGAVAFKRWTDVEPPIEVMFNALLQELAKSR